MWKEPHGFHAQYRPSDLLRSIAWNSHRNVSNKCRMENQVSSVPNWHSKSIHKELKILIFWKMLQFYRRKLTNVAVLGSWARKWSSCTVKVPTNKLLGVTASRVTTFSLWNWTLSAETATSAHTNTKNAIIFTTALMNVIQVFYTGFVKINF